jgi:hypothetical protein
LPSWLLVIALEQLDSLHEIIALQTAVEDGRNKTLPFPD